MSQSDFARFRPVSLPSRDKNPDAAKSARQRIAELPDPYLAHAAPNKEDLVGVIHPVSPAATGTRLRITNSDPMLAAKRSHHKHPEPQTATQPDQSQTTAAGADIKPKKAPAASKRRLPSKLKPILTGLLTFAFLFTVFKSPIFLKQIGYLTAKPAATTTEPNNSAQVPPDPIISIPKINVSAPIVFAQSNVEANIQKDLESGVVHYAHTAFPGEPGNSVIFGHSSNDWWEPGNYKFVFVLLDKLAVGDNFTVNYNSKQYLYQVTETKVVEPTDLSVLSQTPDPQITLITCTPPGTSWKRLIVRAKQISPSPQTAAVDNKTVDTGIKNSLPGSTPSLSDQISKWWKDFTGIFTGN